MLVARNHEFIAATAEYFSDARDGNFVDSGAPIDFRKRQRLVIPSSPDVVVLDKPVNFSTYKPISERIPSLAGAIVAATMVLSPSAYDTEPRQKPNKIDVHYFAASEHALQLKAAIARVDYLATKSEGWKGPDSISMSEAVKSATKVFLNGYFETKPMFEPLIGLDADGDVTLFWKNDRIVMDLSIMENGCYSLYAELHGGKSYEFDDLDVVTPLPEDLMVHLQKYSA